MEEMEGEATVGAVQDKSGLTLQDQPSGLHRLGLAEGIRQHINPDKQTHHLQILSGETEIMFNKVLAANSLLSSGWQPPSVTQPPSSLLCAGEGLLSPENPDKPSSRALPFPPEIKVSCLSARMQKPLPSQHYINIAADKGMHNGVLD